VLKYRGYSLQKESENQADDCYLNWG